MNPTKEDLEYRKKRSIEELKMQLSLTKHRAEKNTEPDFSDLFDAKIMAYETAIGALMRPTLIHCKDCKYYKEFQDSISSKPVKGCTLYFVEKAGHGFCDEAEERTDK